MQLSLDDVPTDGSNHIDHIIRQKGKYHLNLIMQIKCADCGCLPQECIDIKSPRECPACIWKHKKKAVVAGLVIMVLYLTNNISVCYYLSKQRLLDSLIIMRHKNKQTFCQSFNPLDKFLYIFFGKGKLRACPTHHAETS